VDWRVNIKISPIQADWWSYRYASESCRIRLRSEMTQTKCI